MIRSSYIKYMSAGKVPGALFQKTTCKCFLLRYTIARGRLNPITEKRGITNMKKLIYRLIGAGLALLIVYGVQAVFDYVVIPRQIEKLAGTYVTEKQFEAEDVEDLLTDYDFYPEEIALVDLDTLTMPKYVQFLEDKTYTFYYDADAFKANVEALFRQAFAGMYAGRSQLSELYGVDMTAMTEGEFQTFYAELYSQESFDALVSVLTEDAYDYSAIAADTEIGTFTIKEEKILCTINGTTAEESMGYKLENGTLTLTYSNDVEVYTLCK